MGQGLREAIAATIYWPVARSAALAERAGLSVSNWQLAWYRQGSYYRMRTDDQDATQIAIALFGDRPKFLFAAGRILSRHKSQPGRKITTRPERLQIGNDGGDGGCTQNADAGNGLEPLARIARAMQRYDPLLD